MTPHFSRGFALALAAPLLAGAQATADPAAAPLRYRSAFADYRPYREVAPADWKALNAAAGAASAMHGMHGMHDMAPAASPKPEPPPAAPAASVPPATPAGPADHGGHAGHPPHGAPR